MKHRYLLVSILFLFVFEGCKKSGSGGSDTPGPVSNTTYTLTVTGGSGSATYKAGDTADVFSDPPSSTQVFDKWTGDVTNLESPNEWRSILKMPAANVNLVATYKAVPVITFTNVTINGSQVYYCVPANYRGIIMPFHGTGGSASNWADGQAENMNFCRYAVANGYAVLITESTDRVNKMWDLSATNNVDVANIDAILASLKTSGIIATGKPLYGLGMSNGSAFCSLITYLRTFNASALYCYGGIQKVFPLSSVPTIWNMAVNDVTDDPNRQVSAQANFTTLSGKGIASVYYANQPTPLYPSRFAIIQGITTTASASIYDALKAGGYINSKGFFNVDPAIDSSWEAVIPAPYNTLAVQPIQGQLAVSYAQHQFYKDSNYRTIAFFNGF